MTGPATAGDASGRLSREDWVRLEPVLDALLDAPVDRREALLAELSAGDATRRSELERLLADCERQYPLLDRPVASRFGTLLKDAERSMPKELAERYQVRREVGRGGMATVYLAHDVKHGRDVAVKIVRPELAAALGRDRFLREIEIVAQLHHPHIVPLFDSGEVDGALYYVMPYLEGRSLRERLVREGPLPVDQVLAILRDVCDALAHAHQRGLVHRDIKPDNVLLSGRHALVSDFGVARAVSAASDAAHTAAGIIVGTPTYMAPEQATGDPNVDHRADIYALGVLAYEVLSGRPPFTADTPQDIVSAHLVETPEPLTTRRPDVPLVLADLVMTCLAKRPADRWQSADDLLARLESLGARTTPSDQAERLTASRAEVEKADGVRVRARPSWHRYRWAVGAAGAALAGTVFWALRPTDRSTPPRPAPAIAVLLFQSDANPDSGPLALGLTSELIAALGGVAGVDVRSLAAVLPYSSGRIPLDSIGHRLKVRWLVGGRVARRADSVIVSVELTETSTGRRIAGVEQRAASDDDVTFTERVVPAVAAMLRGRIGDEVRLEGWRAGTRSESAFNGVNRAHKATLDADYLAERGDLSGAWASLRRADSALVGASRADRGWVEPLIQRAWVARKTAFVLFGNSVARDSVVATLRRGVEHAEAARRLRPDDPRALEVHGVLLHAQWLLAPPEATASGASTDADSLLAKAESLLTAATRADPTLARALNILGGIHFRRGNVEQARLALNRAYAADAYAEDAQQVLGNLFSYTFVDGDDAEAQRLCRAYNETFPGDWLGGFCQLELMAWDSTSRPDADAAWRIAHAAAAAADEPIRPAAAAQLEVLVAGVLARLGSPDSARRVLDGVRARARSDATVAAEPHRGELLHLEAGARVLLGEPEEAVRLLTDYLASHPERRSSLARDRRFRSLPMSERLDMPERNR